MIGTKIGKKVVNEGQKKYLELTIDDSRDIVDFQIGMINSNVEKGLLNIEKSMFNMTTKLKYNITKFKSLEEYFIDNVSNKQIIINIFTNIANVLIERGELLLEPNNFILDINSVFIHEETGEVALVNIPTTVNYTEDIQEDFIELAQSLLSFIINDGKIANGSEAFIVRLKDKIKKDKVDIVEFVNYLKHQGTEKESKHTVKAQSQEKVKEKQTNEPIRVGEQIYKTQNSNEDIFNYENEIKTQENQRTIKSSTGPRNLQNNKLTVNKSVEVKKESEIKEEYIEVLKIKTGNLVVAIVIQPIFLVIAGGMFLLKEVTLMQSAIGALMMLLIDGIILKNLLSKSKRIKVKMRKKASKVQEKKEDEYIENIAKERAKTEKNKYSKKKKKEEVNTALKDGITVNNEKANLYGNRDSGQVQRQISIPINNNVITNKVNGNERNSYGNDKVELEEETSLDDETFLLDEDTTIESLQAYLEVNNGIKSGSVDIRGAEFVVGRTSNLKEWITTNGISREHFKIINQNDEYFIKDLGSKNGTKINDSRLEENKLKVLNDGDVIKIPSLTITFKLSE